MPRAATWLTLVLIITGCSQFRTKEVAPSHTPKDCAGIRGFNYTPANVEAMPRHHIDCWTHYDETVIESDLDLAKRLDLNQVRVFVPYQVYLEDREYLPGKLRHFVRACHERGIGVMPVVGCAREWLTDRSLRPQAREWAQFLVKTLSNEPGLAFWDVMNEPDWPTTPPERVERECDYAMFMADVFHELDHKTPVTIGAAFVDGMEKMADHVDVLQFHDYSQTRAQIRANIYRAREFAAKVGKPLIDGEIGCIARANPYDITLQEHMDAGVGWYIWELMIVRQGWGPVHGVFYEDGTVRDPSIAAAILGFFRNRGPDILPSDPDREGWVTKVIDKSNAWLADPDASWSDGLDLAETAANLMESAQLVPMRDLPTRQVQLLRQGEPNMPALRELLKKFIATLEPYKKSE